MGGAPQALYDMGSNLGLAAGADLDLDQPLYSVGAAVEDEAVRPGMATYDTADSVLAGPVVPEDYAAASAGMATYDVGGASAPALYAVGNAAEAEDLYSTADGLYDTAAAAAAAETEQPYPLFRSARPTAFGDAGLGLGGSADPYKTAAVHAGQPDTATYDLAATKEMLPSFDESALEMMDKLVGVDADEAPRAGDAEGDARFLAKSFRLNDGSDSVRLMSVRRVNPLYKGSVRAKLTKSIVSSDGAEAC